jgi:hypothetical protein
MYCTKQMQARIEQHPDYNSKLKHKPIAVLEDIQMLMHDPIRAQYPLVSMTDHLMRLSTSKQHDNELLIDFVKPFKQTRDVAKSQLGSTFLNEFVEHQSTYKKATTTEQNEMKKQIYSQWMAYLVVRGCDQLKYGSLTRGLTSQFSLGQDQYPKTIQAALDMLTNHRMNKTYYDNQLKRNLDRSDKEQPTSSNNEDAKASSFVQQGREMTCYRCGKKGHLSPDCEKKDTIPREQWHVTRAMQNLQDTNHENDDNEKTTKDMIEDSESNATSITTASQNTRSGTTTTSPSLRALVVSWSGLQFQQETYNEQQHQNLFAHLKEVILLDTGSTLKASLPTSRCLNNQCQ